MWSAMTGATPALTCRDPNQSSTVTVRVNVHLAIVLVSGSFVLFLALTLSAWAWGRIYHRQQLQQQELSAASSPPPASLRLFAFEARELKVHREKYSQRQLVLTVLTPPPPPPPDSYFHLHPTPIKHIAKPSPPSPTTGEGVQEATGNEIEIGASSGEF